MGDFFWRYFLEGFFWEDFLGRIFWEDFFWEEFFGRNYLVGFYKELMVLSRFWVNFVSMKGRRKRKEDFRSSEVRRKLIALKKENSYCFSEVSTGC